MDQYHFKMKTAKACFVPLVQCSAETQHNEVFNFEKLRTREWDFTLPDSTVKYQIKVCGSLPIMARELGHYSVYPCQQQTGICTFDDAEVKGTNVEPRRDEDPPCVQRRRQHLHEVRGRRHRQH